VASDSIKAKSSFDPTAKENPMTAFRAFPCLVLANAALPLLLLAGCASPPLASEAYIAPKPGSTVEYRMTNTGSFGNGTSLAMMRITEATWKGQPVLRYEGPAGSVLNNDQAGAVAILDPSGRPAVEYEPALGYQWPLTVGKTWESNHVVTTATGSQFPMKASWKVEALENVVVPAGSFRAWRVTMTDNLGLRQTSWSVPQKLGMFAKRLSERTASHPQGAGTQLYEMTQIPAVR
jgi:hypothetical protein